uniref:E3 ubiquitin-protein ligase RBBP6 n=1 Tax=Parascaris univalens TaxID=6257 RepID=A0A915BQD7_PARUN
PSSRFQAMSSIHYKFKATLEYKTLTFNGLHISVNDLKKEICEKENIKAESFDLLLTNAHTKRQYNSDEFIPRNSSVVVQRSPRDNAVKLPKVQDSTNSGIVSKGTTTDGTCKGHMGSAQFNQLSEEERIAHIKEVSAFKYQPSNFQKKSSSILWGPPPPTYQCNRCSQSGHWYKNCPMLNTRRTTGITMDELMETTADDPLAMLHPSGKFVVPIMHWKARQQKKTELSRAPEPDNRVIPPELKCPLCAQLLRDAVLTTCCGDSFCAECVQQRLLESVNAKCPGANCIQTSISADKIVPNLKVRQAVEAFKKAASPAQNVASSSQRSPVLQQRSLDTPQEPPKVQAQPVPRVRIGLGSRMQAAQQLDSSQQNAMPTHEQQPQPSSAASSLEDSGISNMSMGVQAIRPHVPVPQQQQQQQLPQLPPPPAPQPQPVVGGVVLAPAPPSLESPKMANTIAMPPMAPMAPPITPMLLPVGGVLPVNVHEPPPGYAPVVTSAPPTAPIPASTKVIASADGRGVASMLPSMTAPPPPIIVQPPPLQQPPPPGLHTATTFPPVPAPPQVRDAWDEFLERKEKDRLLGATQVSRRRHSSPSESYSSTESSTQSSSDSRSRSRSWSRERGRRERRHDSKERRRNRRIESRSPPRLYAGPPRYYRDSASSHNIYQHPPPAPLNASQTTFAHHRLPALINYPPPSFLQTSNTSLAGFQSMPGSLPPAGGYRGARGCVDDRSQRRRSPPRVTETDRRVSKRGSTGREREGDRKRTDESRRRVRENEERNVRGDERPGRSRPREGAE